jgi:hypothetical protein
LAFTHIECGFGQVVFEVFHLDETVVRDDREGGIKRGLQAFVGAFFGCNVCLQKRGVRVLLHLQQVWNFQHAVAAAETFADALAFGKCVGHEFSGLDSLGDWGRTG